MCDSIFGCEYVDLSVNTRETSSQQRETMPTTAIWCMVAGFPPTPPYRVLPGVVRVGMLRAQASDEDEYLDDLENRVCELP